MTKGLFTSTEEIKFQYAFVTGHVGPVRDSTKNQGDIRQENRRVSQNVKRINQRQI